MTTCEQVPLGKICTVNPRAERHQRSGDTLVTFVPMAAVDSQTGTITVRQDRPLAEVASGFTVFRDGDVLFAKITPCMQNGKAALIRDLTNGIGRGSTEFYVLRPGRRVLGEYLWHFVRQPRFREAAKRSFTGTAGQQRVPRSFMENALIPLPPLYEQRRIVDVLNRAARIEALRRQAAERLGEFVRALFFEMFGSPHRDAMAWPVCSVEQILKDGRRSIRTGPFGSQLKHSEFTSKGVPVLGIDNVVKNRFTWTKPRHVSDEKYASFRRYRVFPGDVIVTIMGTTGRVCVTPDDLPECMSTKHLCVVTPDRTRVEPLFLWGALLFDERVREQTSTQAQGQIMEGWNLSIVKSLRLRVPPLSAQRLFSQIMARALAIETSVSTLTQTTSELRNSLMSNLLQDDVPQGERET